MITLDTDMYLLCNMFNISYKKISNEYSGMTVEQIMEAEAAQGNTAAANFDSSILTDPVKLIELFKLDNISNKYAILSNMNEHDLENLLPLLSSEDLIIGLNYFTKDKLLKLTEQLPKDQLLKYVFEMFSPQHLMELMPEEQLNKVLTSTELDKNMVMKFLPSLDPQVLAQMYEGATGLEAPSNGNNIGDIKPNYDVSQLVQNIASLPDDKFQEALLSMPPANKQAFVLILTQQNPKLFQAIDSAAYVNIIGSQKDKENMIRAANVIDKEHLVGMISELPKDLMSAVLTQIDTNKFADRLLANFKNIIEQIVAG